MATSRVPIVGVIELGEGREVRRRGGRIEAGDPVEARRPDRLPVGEGDPPVADAGELLGHGQQVIGAGLLGGALGDLMRLTLELRLVRAPLCHRARERGVRFEEPQMRHDDRGEVLQRCGIRRA